MAACPSFFNNRNLPVPSKPEAQAEGSGSVPSLALRASFPQLALRASFPQLALRASFPQLALRDLIELARVQYNHRNSPLPLSNRNSPRG
jgi:hypothetical protein